MELAQIQNYLNSPNPQERMKGIVELRNYDPAVVVPLLKQKMYDQEFVIRSFVAMGLGFKRTDEAYQSLLDLIENDRDANVRAEAANSLAKYGNQSIPHLMELFRRDSNWLVRQSIFAAIDGLDYPEMTKILFQMANWGLAGDDLVVKLVSIASLGKLALANFDDPKAKAALTELRNDKDYRVVAATLETLIQQ